MTKVSLIGTSSLIGRHFIDNNKNYELTCFSRTDERYNYLDLNDTNTFSKYTFESSFLVSFAPIWLTKNLINYLDEYNLSVLKQLQGIIVFSSTSAITKRFASNDFDKKLAKILLNSENEILSVCKKYSINCRIIRPTIIYGVYKELHDGNFSRIIKFFRKTPICLIPLNTGYRQPIHFSQLSKLTFIFLNLFKKNLTLENNFKIVEVGGDEELTYKDLLFRLSRISEKKYKNKCKLIPLPNELFLLIISPLLVLNPKLFDALYRMQADLSGFTKYSYFSGEEPVDVSFDNY